MRMYEFAQIEHQHLVFISKDRQIHSQRKLHYVLTYPAVAPFYFISVCGSEDETPGNFFTGIAAVKGLMVLYPH
jgi:hypothetical protein